MKNTSKLLYFQIFSFIFTVILGTLLHFTYEWSNNNSFVALFSAVNESTWEHLKLVFFPMFFTTIIGYFFIVKNSLNLSNFLCARTISILFSMLLIIVLFYTLSGVLGTNIDILNIAIFFISIFLGDFIAYKVLVSNFLCNNKIAIFVLLFLFICFITFTFFPPKIGLFKDPLTNTFGIIN